MPNTDSGRSSPRLVTDDRLKQMICDIHATMDSVKTDVCTIREDNEIFREQIFKHGKEIAELKAENIILKSDVKLLNETVTKLEQYSRKDVIILTGLEFKPSEQQRELEHNVVDILNQISGNSLTHLDFVAIHRNSRVTNTTRNRPPTVTIKFLRYTDKDILFTKRCLGKRKQMFPHLNYHHCLCPALIEVQRLIAADPNVKFVRYDGPSRYFTVCLNAMDNNGRNILVNRIQDIACFKAELLKLKK